MPDFRISGRLILSHKNNHPPTYAEQPLLLDWSGMLDLHKLI